MAITELLTIGYEGADLDGFICGLQKLRVNVVVDVRELPLSRKRGFSKVALGEALAAAGIDYRHERAFGCPPEIRNELKLTGDYDRYFKRFNRYLATRLPELKALGDELDGRVALLCFERDAERCHRRSVAERLKELFALNPRHVLVPI